MEDMLHTWFSMRQSPSLAKLYRVFISKEWDGKFGLATADSIHVPIFLRGKIVKKLKRIFRPEKWWLEHQEARELVKVSRLQPTTTGDTTKNIYIELRRLRNPCQSGSDAIYKMKE